MTYKSRRIRRIKRETAARARRRRLLVKVGAVLAVLTVIAAAGISSLAEAFARSAEVSYETVIVAEGDTLWDIAAEHNSGGRDVRTLVDAIVRANGMTGGKICAGDRVYVPVY